MTLFFGSGELKQRWFALLVAALVGIGTADASDRYELEQALARDPANVDIEFHLALVLAREGALKDAEAAAMKVVEAAPEYWDAHILLARIAGWKKEYDKALSRLEIVLKNHPDHREAVLLKLDILTWKEDTDAAGHLVDNLLAAGNVTADLYFRKAQIAKQELSYLTAYRLAQTALTLDPLHEPSKEIVQNTRLVAVYFNNEVEYFGYRNTPLGKKWGYGFSVAGQVLPRSRISGTVIDIFRYRFQTVNNQVGLEGVFRPTSRIDLTLRGMLGAPAVVLPRGTGFFSIRTELVKRLDATLSYQLDVLSWPVDRPGLLQRPALDVGVLVHRYVRLGAGYTLGLFHYCGEPVSIFHGGRCSALFDNERFSFSLSYGYGEEYEQNEALPEAQYTCGTFSEIPGGAQELIGVTSHTIGIAASRVMSKTFTLRGGYALTALQPNSSNVTTITHVIHIGGVMWF